VGITNNTTPTSSYLVTANNTTEQRMAAGGYRLADLLNTIYSTNGPRLGSLTRTNGKFTFSWNSVPGRTYKIQRKQQFTDSGWTDVTNFIASTNTAAFKRNARPNPTLLQGGSVRVPNSKIQHPEKLCVL
jgi:hypothetical protein